MTHTLMIIVFAALVGLVFGVVGRSEPKAQAKYGMIVFAKFVGVGLLLGWVLYFVPL